MYKEIASNKRRTFLLLFLFLIFIIGLGWVFSYIYDNPIILVVAVLWSFFQAFVSYWWSDQITLLISRAREVPRAENLQLHRLVENLAIAAGLPKPRIYIIEDPSPNAFATGRDPSHAVLCVTRGLLDRLNKVQLEGVISHELSHIGNYDIRLMTVIVVLVGAVALLSNWFLRWGFWGGGRRREGGGVLMLVGLVLAILAPISAMLVQLAISRKREFLADANGALLTRYPEGLAEALEIISKDGAVLATANNATNHLYIVNPLNKQDAAVGFWANLFSTHPPVKERIKRLRDMIE